MAKKLDSSEQRKRILVTAAEIFREKTFLDTTVDDLAEALQINKATIYYYFESKANLLYEIMSSAFDEFIEKAHSIIATDASPADKLKALVELHISNELTSNSLAGVAHFEMKNLPPKLGKLYIAKRDKYERTLRSIFQEGIRLSQFRENDADMTTRFILGLINSVTIWFKKSGPLSSRQVSEEIWEFIAHSIQADPGTETQITNDHRLSKKTHSKRSTKRF